MSDRIGQQLGNYRIQHLLGHGGFAEVYLGEHIFLNTPVAIKMLHAHLGDARDREDFLKEARIVARLIHPNIIRVTDFGIIGDTPYLIMDYAPNGTLRQHHPRGSRLPLPVIVSYVKQIAAALSHAHEEKLVHRDIKPENMLVGRRKEILLGDFGIALVSHTSRSSNTQDVVGTVAYMAPEQIQGKPRYASDLYALAVIVYEWLCGDPPFRGSFTELCTQHMFATPPPLRDRVPDLLPDVEQVITIALSKEPDRRFGSVLAFARALEQASQVGPIEVPQPSQPMPLILPDPVLRQPSQAMSPVSTDGEMLQPQMFASEAHVPIPVIEPPSTPPAAITEATPIPPTVQATGETPRQTGETPRLTGPYSSPGLVGAPSQHIHTESSGPVFPYSSYPSRSYYPHSATRHTTPPIQQVRRAPSIWGFGFKQMLALVFSLVLFNLAGHLRVDLEPYNLPSLVLTPLALLFCSTAFGPWVGLLTGGLGVILDPFLHYPYWHFSQGKFSPESLSRIPEVQPIHWPDVGLVALAGFLIGATGFALFYRQTGMPRFSAALIAVLLGGLIYVGYSITRFFVVYREQASVRVFDHLNAQFFLELALTLGALFILLLFYSILLPRPQRMPPELWNSVHR